PERSPAAGAVRRRIGEIGHHALPADARRPPGARRAAGDAFHPGSRRGDPGEPGACRRVLQTALPARSLERLPTRPRATPGTRGGTRAVLDLRRSAVLLPVVCRAVR